MRAESVDGRCGPGQDRATLIRTVQTSHAYEVTDESAGVLC